MNSGVHQGWWSGAQGDKDAGYHECGTTKPRQGGGMDRQGGGMDQQVQEPNWSTIIEAST